MRGTTAADENNGDNHENNYGSELEAGAQEFLFSIAKCAEYVDDNDDNPKERDPNCGTDVSAPILDGERADGQFER